MTSRFSSNKKKVLVISRIDTPDNIKGGVESAFYSQYQFHRDGYYINVSNASDNFEGGMITIKPFKYYLNILSIRKQIQKIIEKNQIDVIHLHGVIPFAYFIPSKYWYKIVCTQHGVLGDEMSLKKGVEKLYWVAKYIAEKRAIARIDKFICISKYNEKYLKTINPIAKTTIIPNPVSQEFLDKPISSEWSLNRIIYVGVINERKNLHFIIENYNNIESIMGEIQLIIIGGAGDKEYLEKAIRKSVGKRIKFLGWQSQSDIIKEMDQCGLLILPSIQETLPISIIEAQARGLYVIATDVGGISELIDNDEGGVFPMNDADIFLHNLKNYKKKYNETMRHIIASSARGKYSGKIIINKLRAYYGT